MVIAETITGLGAVKTAFDLAKSLKDINDTTVRNGVVIELQDKILSAQEAQGKLLDRVKELEQQIAELKAWDAEKDRYELVQLYRGPFARILKIGQENGEAAHALCANCYDRGLKSILQPSGHMIVHDHTWDCPTCKTKTKCQDKDMKSLIERTRNQP